MDLDVDLSGLRKPKYIENGDPLQDEEKLLQGLLIVEPEDVMANTIRKVPSDEALMPLRWGSNRRATGRSKSGLQVRLQNLFAHCVPIKNLRMNSTKTNHAPFSVTPFSFSTLRTNSGNMKILVPRNNSPTSLIFGEALSGKSIVYTYTSSSSSSSGRIVSSFGAVGDHLTSIGSANLPRSAVITGGRSPSARPERTIRSATTRTRSPLADLVLSSTPDEEPYHLVALGHIGPLKQPFTPQLVKPADLCTLTRRRRSLSDLREAPQARQSSLGAEGGVSKSQIAVEMNVLGLDDIQTVGKDSVKQPDELYSMEAADPPMWSRKGPPFDLNRRDHSLDPQTFSLPFGVCRNSCTMFMFHQLT